MTVDIHFFVDDKLTFKCTLDEILATIGGWHSPEQAMDHWINYPHPQRKLVTHSLVEFYFEKDEPISKSEGIMLQNLVDQVMRYRTAKNTDDSISKL